MFARGTIVAATIIFVACSPPSASSSAPDLPEAQLGEFQETLAASDQPTVVNVWASWCLPCRDEAPLLAGAVQEYGDRVAFIGVAWNDNQPGAKDFLAEFDLTFPQYFDREGVIVAAYGGLGIPRTYFFAPGGELVSTYNGPLDADAFALQIDELLKR